MEDEVNGNVRNAVEHQNSVTKDDIQILDNEILILGNETQVLDDEALAVATPSGACQPKEWTTGNAGRLIGFAGEQGCINKDLVFWAFLVETSGLRHRK